MEAVQEWLKTALPSFDNIKPQEQEEPETEKVETLIKRAKITVEMELDEAHYDRVGIKPEYWDFLIQLAAERIVMQRHGYKEGVGRLTKEKVGFVLHGLPHTGKTFLLRILAKIKAIPDPVGEAVLKNVYQAGGLDRLFNAYPAIRSKDFTLDDLGIVQDAKSYGNSGLIENILFERYEHWQGRAACTTFISSNIAGYKQFETIYGSQIANRIADMCVIIPVEGSIRGESATKKFIIRKENENEN